MGKISCTISPQSQIMIFFSFFLACTDPQEDPTLDLDEDSFTNQEEWDAGSDPNDPDDIPYIGGWGKDAECRFDIQPTGNDVGQVAEDFALQDQFGDIVHLHDFCARPILLEFTGFT